MHLTVFALVCVGSYCSGFAVIDARFDATSEDEFGRYYEDWDTGLGVALFGVCYSVEGYDWGREGEGTEFGDDYATSCTEVAGEVLALRVPYNV